MDQTTRNHLQRATQDARRLLEVEFGAQFEGTFDILLNGTILPEVGAHLDERQRLTRKKLVEAIEHIRVKDPNKSNHEAVSDYLREAAFTFLNRLAALRMLESRGLVQQCVSKGDQSSGFKEFCGLAPGLGSLPDKGYQLYLECLFDEMATEIKILFDRRDSASLLWPRRQALLDLLAIFNRTALQGVWGDEETDETIGWIYQYYNDEAERRKMREDSPAPRNSRELAVRNQFFTPRYVVEFLTDNTLGRLWCEMTRGETIMRERCRYLVRRSTEIFLKPGESEQESDASKDTQLGEIVSQEKLLRERVHIPHRQLKDPRTIKLLDPACGSMHFGLYAFDLFTVLYDEAWEIAQRINDESKGAAAFAPFVSFAATFPDKAAFLQEVPRLIIENNIHGIDIDPRAAQIAGLSLWLRAQRAWQQSSVRPTDRPRISRSNVVCAQPMPGEKELLSEFVEQHFPAEERPAFAFLLGKIFDRMTLAGEAGSLLRIEEDIRSAIVEAHTLATRQAVPIQAHLFPRDEEPQQLAFILRDLNDDQFWQEAEQRIYVALKTYAEQAEDGGGFQRRLFSGDAAQGFAFIDLCRKRYDVVVMNPPFGSPPVSIAPTLSGDAANNVYPAFVLRGADLCDGFVGAITDRTFVVQQSFGKFRERLISDLGLVALAELGWGVLDGADVQVAAYFIRKGAQPIHLFATIGTAAGDPGNVLMNIITDSKWTALSKELIHKLPNSAFAYTLPAAYLTHIESQRALRDIAELPRGLGSNDANRTYKAWYEVPVGSIGEGRTYRSLSNGGPSSPFFRDDAGVAEWLRRDGKLLVDHGYSDTNKAYDQKSNYLYFLAGLSFPKQASSFNVAALPEDAIPTREGKGVIPHSKSDLLPLLAYLNSSYARLFVEATNGLHKQSGPVGMTPVPNFTPSTRAALGALALEGWRTIAERYVFDEASRIFAIPATAVDVERLGDCDLSKIIRDIDAVVFDAVGVGTVDRGMITSLSRAAAAYFQPTQADTLSYALGCTLGRWDIRFATGERTTPELPDPFAPLPICPPAMLQGNDGLPLSPDAGRKLRAEGSYPLDVAWDGLLVDDPEHPLDIERHIHTALAVIWGDRADALQHEACALLGVLTLREWFRKPTGFFADHLKRYSKSRRQAPIYWPLSTTSGNYSVWFYYHRMRRDTLALALEQAKEKLRFEQRKLEALRVDLGPNPTRGQREELEAHGTIVGEITGFVEELSRVSPLWNPNLNDGVIINYAPLWRMVGHTPWRKSVKECWDALVAGNYDWAHLAMHLWPERVVPKCFEDASLAIAHGLDDVFWVKDDRDRLVKRSPPEGGWEPVIARLITERSSVAVKAALQSLLDAPPLAGAGGGRRGAGRVPAPRRAPRVVAQADTEVSPRPTRTRTVPSPVDAQTLDLIKHAVGSAPEGASKAEVLSATGLTDARWNAAISQLLEQGVITRSGERRGTRYHLAQGTLSDPSNSTEESAMEGQS